MDQDQNGKVGFRKQAIRFEIFASSVNDIVIVLSTMYCPMHQYGTFK